jgi:hypothetical protein
MLFAMNGMLDCQCTIITYSMEYLNSKNINTHLNIVSQSTFIYKHLLTSRLGADTHDEPPNICPVTVLVLSGAELMRKRQIADFRGGSRRFPVLVLSREEFIPSAKSHTAAVEAERFQCSF